MISVDTVSLKRFYYGGEARVLLDVDLGDLELFEEDLREIAAGRSERLLAASGNTTMAEQWVTSTGKWSLVLAGCRDFDDAVEWLTDLAQQWSRAGDGRIVGGPRSRSERKIDPRPALTGYLYLTTSDLRLVASDDRGPFWGVEPTTTQYVAEQMLHWVHLPRAREFLLRDADWSVPTESLDHAQTMAEAIERYAMLAIRATVDEPLRQRGAAMWPGGQVMVQTVDRTRDWADLLEEIKACLLWSPPRTDYAYIRQYHGGGIAPEEGRTWPHITDNETRYSRPLLASFVPDAFGMQIVTQAHLDRAHDLSAWDITELANHRFLVAARDLEPWFRLLDDHDQHGNCMPLDHKVVHQARADFGDMILTPDLINQHNPWT